MLVLTRKVNESIEASGPCRITIVSIGPGDRMRIGLEGPAETEFLRTEISGDKHATDHRDG